MKKLMFATIAIFAMLALWGCSGDPEDPPKDKPSVTSVSVTPATVNVQQGGTQAFTASVAVKGGAAKTVTWKITDEDGDAIAATTAEISASGSLSVKDAATATSKIIVTATSTVDTSKKGTATVTVTAKPVTVSVAVTPEEIDLKKGATSAAFIATVTGATGTPTVTWSLVASDDDTALSEDIATIDGDQKVTVQSSAAVGTTFRVKAAVTGASGYATVNIVDKVIDDIRIVAADGTVKKSYEVMDGIDTTGLEVYLVYTDGDGEVKLELNDTRLSISPQQFTTAGTSIEVTVNFNDGHHDIDKTYAVVVAKRTLTAANFEITSTMAELHDQNIKNGVTPIEVEAVTTGQHAPEYTIGAVTVLYNGVAGTPNKAGTFAITIDVAGNDVYEAATGLDMSENLIITKVVLFNSDFDYDNTTLFPKGQILTTAVGGELTATWADPAVWNNNGAVAVSVIYVLSDDTTKVFTKDTLPNTPDTWYQARARVAEYTDYIDAYDVSLFSFEVVSAYYAAGEAKLEIEKWEFTEQAPVIVAGTVSKTGAGGAVTKIDIEAVGTFDEYEWYLNGTKTAETTDTYELTAAGLGLGGPQFVTVRVRIGTKWFSRTVEFTVNP